MTVGRAHLLDASLFVPEGTRRSERAAAQGQISAGNGERLASFIENDEWEQVRSFLAICADEGRSKQCNGVLISSERLLSPLSKNQRLRQLNSIVDETLNSSWECLLILRDPIDQAISLYKHRAKSGKARQYREWLSCDYHVAQDLGNLRMQIAESQINVTTMGYHSDGNELASRFFKTWLGVDVPQATLADRVNPSLRFSELEIIRNIAQMDRRLVEPVYQTFLKLSSAEKSPDTEFERYARLVAANKLAQNQAVWEFWNDRMPNDQRFHMPERKVNVALNEQPPNGSLSPAQIRTLTQFFVDSRRLGFRLKIGWISQLRPLLARIWRIIGLKSS